MKITELKVNYVENPIGYDLSFQTFSWKYEETEAPDTDTRKKIENLDEAESRTLENKTVLGTAGVETEGRIKESRIQIALDENFAEMIFDSGFSKDISGIAYCLKLGLSPRTRYFWKVETGLYSGEIISSSTAFFETGKMTETWTGQWIGVEDDSDIDKPDRKASPVLRKEFEIRGKIKSARLYMTGLGLYECCLNHVLVNDGYLQPGFNNYNFWLQTDTFDVTEEIMEGRNALAIMLGAGWYKGRFGVNGGFENLFGKNYHVCMELHVSYEDGTEDVIGSDESFRYDRGPVLFSNIYDGEIYDASKETPGWMDAGFDDDGWEKVKLLTPEKRGAVTDRFSVPVEVMEKHRPKEVIIGAAGTKILDMGQNMTGWLTFQDMLTPGQKVTCRFAEHMQDGKIYQGNLAGAKQEFIYTSAGDGRTVRPHFTYFGFRYVEIKGFPENVKPEDFEGWCLYSDMDTTGHLSTGHENLNQFIRNAFWSQKDNFLEHPTDCPQRGERLGWTGDAQMYAKTACYNMYTPAFYRKYMKDVNEEQKDKGGLVPFIIPKTKGRGFSDPDAVECSAAWSDVATIIPWALYVYYGDTNLLEEEYPGMKAWVDYMIGEDEKNGNKKLWQTGFHFGDWLALDNPEPGPFGKTDKFYVASCYYYHSTAILAKAAAALDKKEDAARYGNRAKQIRQAVCEEYFDEEQICKIDTQTGYVLAIYMDLVDEAAQKKNGEKLVEKIKANGGHLDTGFVGTVYIALALSKAGFAKEAYDLLLVEDCPGWMYQVECGATTVWESWTALDKNGRITGDMSLNHYAFGSIVEWIYKEACGLKPMEEYPGFRKALIEPEPDPRLHHAEAVYDSAAGRYRVRWEYLSSAELELEVDIPLNGSARLELEGAGLKKELTPGTYRFIVEM